MHDSCTIPAGLLLVMALSHRDLWDTGYVKSELATRAVSEAKVFLYFLAITTFDWFPLAVVVGWKFVVAMAAAAWALSQVLAGQPEHVTRWSVVALGCLGNALMFLRIGQHLKALNRATRS